MFIVFYKEILFCVFELLIIRMALDIDLGLYGCSKQTFFEKCSWRQDGDPIQRKMEKNPISS